MKRWILLTCTAVLTLGLVGCAASADPDGGDAAGGSNGPVVRVGSLLDSEGTVLGSMVLQMLEQNGIPTEDKTKLGTPDVVREALLQGEIDATITYTGSGQYYHEGEEGDAKWQDADTAYAAIKELDKAAFDIDWLTPAPANNAEYIAVNRAFAEANGIVTLEDFANYVNGGGEVKLIGAQTWMDSPIGLAGLEDAYGFTLDDSQLLGLSHGNTAEMLTALARGTDGVNFSLAYGTDGQLTELDLVIIEGGEGIAPVYNPTPAFRGEIIKAYPNIPSILEPVFLTLDQATLQKLNARVSFGGEQPAAVAKDYLTTNGFLK